MKLDIGDKITANSIQGDNVVGNVTTILENTVILFCGLTSYVVSKKELKKQGYKFTKKKKGSKPIQFASVKSLN